MFLLMTALLACGSDPVPEAVDEPTQPAEAAPAIPEPAAPAPAGSIGGEPILPDVVVIGGISAKSVSDTIDAGMTGIAPCYTGQLAANADLAGKVLVRFIITGDGTVSRSRIKSTSLRHEPTETCVNDAVTKLVFPKLQSGKTAIVVYPFVFPS